MPHLRRSTAHFVSVLAVLAFALLPPLPARHLHPAGIEGRIEPLVHAHGVSDQPAMPRPGETALGSSHGDHLLAVFLSSQYMAPTVAVAAAVAPGRVVTVEAPMSNGPAILPPSDWPHIHGPPRIVSITRGPPVLS